MYLIQNVVLNINRDAKNKQKLKNKKKKKQKKKKKKKKQHQKKTKKNKKKQKTKTKQPLPLSPPPKKKKKTKKKNKKNKKAKKTQFFFYLSIVSKCISHSLDLDCFLRELFRSVRGSPVPQPIPHTELLTEVVRPELQLQTVVCLRPGTGHHASVVDEDVETGLR